MAEHVVIKKNDSGGAILYVSLVDTSAGSKFKANPTLATGDVKVSLDGGAFADLGTLPTVTPAGGIAVKVTLSQAEINADNIILQFIDAAGAEWADLMLNIPTGTRKLEDLAHPATSGRSMNVAADGLVDADAVKWNTEAIPATTITGVPEVDVTHAAGTILSGSTPDVNVTQISGDTTAADNAEAFFDGTGYAGTNNVIPSVTTVTGNVDGTVAGVTPAAAGAAMALTSGERTTLAGVIWDSLTSGMTTVGSIGKKLADWVVGTIDTYTGNTKQTGDNYARLGAPAGASVSADVAAVKVDTAATLVDTGTTLPATLGAPAGADLAADIAAVKVDTAATLVDTAEIGAAGAGLTEAGGTGDHLTALPWNAAWDAEVESEVNDAIDTAISELGVAAPTATPTLRTGMMLMYMALRNKLITQTSGTDALEIHNDAGTKIAAKAITDDGSDYTEAKMA